ncbi:HAD family hydrolase [Salinisphaera sp. T31B1]|uniref:HAD family hydrolase n=1 Tax=Salinisphaera sp. T31B1 TaxID=727963 RepID=UPI00333FB91C
MRSHYRLLSFDGDMTLWNFDAGMRAALEATRRALIERRPTLAAALPDIRPMMAVRERILADASAAGLSFAAIRRRAFRTLLVEHDAADDRLGDQLYAVYLEHRLKATPLYRDVVPLFARLDSDLHLALLSNGNTHPKHLGIADRFDVIAFAGAMYRAKPSPDLFDYAFDHLGCRAEHTIHVGDSLAADVAGAHAVGATSVWLNRDGRPNDTAIVPDHTIASLAELKALL